MYNGAASIDEGAMGDIGGVGTEKRMGEIREREVRACQYAGGAAGGMPGFDGWEVRACAGWD